MWIVVLTLLALHPVLREGLDAKPVLDFKEERIIIKFKPDDEVFRTEAQCQAWLVENASVWDVVAARTPYVVGHKEHCEYTNQAVPEA